MGRDEECRRAHDETGKDAFALRGEIERVRQQLELAESKISATVFTELRGMEARMVVVALVYIATKIALLCLDEPTAGMSAAETHEAINFLKLGMEKSKFRGREDNMKLIEALEGLEMPARPRERTKPRHSRPSYT